MNDGNRRAPSRAAHSTHIRNITPLGFSGMRSNSPNSRFSKAPPSTVLSKLSSVLRLFRKRPSNDSRGMASLTSPEHLSGVFDRKPSYPYTQSSDSDHSPHYAHIQLDREATTVHSFDTRPSTMFEMREMDAERMGGVDDTQRSNFSHDTTNRVDHGLVPTYHSHSPSSNQRQQERQYHRRSQSATTHTYAHRDKVLPLLAREVSLVRHTTTDVRADAMAMAGIPIPAATSKIYDVPFDGSDSLDSGVAQPSSTEETAKRALDDPFYAYYHHRYSRSVALHPSIPPASSNPFSVGASNTSTNHDRDNGGKEYTRDGGQGVRQLKPLPAVPSRGGARQLFR